jgi:hypothetical protein
MSLGTTTDYSWNYQQEEQHQDSHRQTRYQCFTELRGTEWTTKPSLVHLQSLKNAFTNGGEANSSTMHLITLEQYEEVKGLVKAHNLQGSLTLVFTDEAKHIQGGYHTRITARRKHQQCKTHEVAL